jgi:putative DNA primase/helicase
LLHEVETAIRRHAVLSEHQALAVGLWNFHAHAITFAEHSPRLHIASPAKRCGKTVLLSTVARMVPRGLWSESITTASMFRVIEMYHPTMLIDEVDTFLKDNEDMRALLNAGHGRNGQCIRTVGDDHEPRGFRVFGAVVIAGIGRIPDTVEDRSITINMRRKLADEYVERLREADRKRLEDLGRQIARWVADNGSKLNRVQFESCSL